MPTMTVVLRVIHILSGVYWAGSVFLFSTILQPAVQDLGPDGGKVMVKLFERGYLTILPIAAVLTVGSGVWLLWIASSGFTPEWMGSTTGIVLSTGGTLAIAALAVGLGVMRPSGMRLWAIARELPTITDEGTRNARMAEMQARRIRLGVAGRIVFFLLIAAVLAMASARYL